MVAAAHLAAFESLAGIAQEKASIFRWAGARRRRGLQRRPRHHADPARQGCRRHAARPVLRRTPPAHHRVQAVSVEDACTVASGPLRLRSRGDALGAALQGHGAGAAFRGERDGRAGPAAMRSASTGRCRSGARPVAPGSGRGARERITLDAWRPTSPRADRRQPTTPTPPRVGAALDVLAAARPAAGLGRVARGRRIAYLGDMKELGATEAALHARWPSTPRWRLAACIAWARLMRHLWEALPPGRAALLDPAARKWPSGVARASTRAMSCWSRARCPWGWGAWLTRSGKWISPKRAVTGEGVARMLYWLTESRRGRRLQPLPLHHLPGRRRLPDSAASASCSACR